MIRKNHESVPYRPFPMFWRVKFRNGIHTFANYHHHHHHYHHHSILLLILRCIVTRLPFEPSSSRYHHHHHRQTMVPRNCGTFYSPMESTCPTTVPPRHSYHQYRIVERQASGRPMVATVTVIIIKMTHHHHLLGHFHPP